MRLQDARAILEILEEKRSEVLRRTEAAAVYLIKNWQELTHQVRALLLEELSLRALRFVKTERGKMFQQATLQKVEERGRKWGKLSARMPTLQVD